MHFNREEINLLSLYNTGSKDETLMELREMQSYLLEDETDLKHLSDKVISKIQSLSDHEYMELLLTYDI